MSDKAWMDEHTVWTYPNGAPGQLVGRVRHWSVMCWLYRLIPYTLRWERRRFDRMARRLGVKNPGGQTITPRDLTWWILQVTGQHYRCKGHR